MEYVDYTVANLSSASNSYVTIYKVQKSGKDLVLKNSLLDKITELFNFDTRKTSLESISGSDRDEKDREVKH